jgi:hypothetical protein
MKLGELWAALCAGDPTVLETAYLHRAHRERGSLYLKGREDIAADWGCILGIGRRYELLVDLGDAAMVRTPAGVWHHWVRREGSRIAREVLVAENGRGLSPSDVLVSERELGFGAVTAELAHLLTKAAEGSPLRHIVSRFHIEGVARLAIGVAVPNG